MKEIEKKNKKQRGITLVALVITIVILIILATVTINMAFGDNGLVKYAEEARDKTANSTIAEAEGINSMVDQFANVMAEDGEATPPGPTELPADGSYDAEKGVNTPNIGNNMELVKFDEEKQDWVVDETNSEYSYKDTSTEGENTSEWANAKVTIDGIDSYFVWIPRYAYKITYYTDEDKTTISSTPTAYGTIDIKFLQGTSNIAADGVTVCKYADENPTADDYIIHPAFTKDANYGGGFGNDNGTSDNGIAGIWIGKYEASLANKADGTNIVTNDTGTGDILLSEHTDKTVVTKPGYSSWRYITIGNMYTNAKAYDTNLKSHMLKNSEWGAVAYLTESKYGRNETEVTINNNGTTFYTGGGEEKAYLTNIPQSSTGNVYGIYDLSGNAYEYVATGYQNQSSIGTSSGSNEYGTVYTTDSESTGYKYGDATYETSGWNLDNAYFVRSDSSFFDRGGNYNVSDRAGVFYYGSSGGYSSNEHSFRLALVV